MTWKGSKRDIIAIHPETAHRLCPDLEAMGHANDRVDWVVQKSVKRLRLGHDYSAHAMRATFITTALENGAKLEDVQRMVAHADPSTTQLYDRRPFMPTKSGALVVAYDRLA